MFICAHVYTQTHKPICHGMKFIFWVPVLRWCMTVQLLQRSGRRLATVPVGKEAGVLLVLQTVQLKTRLEHNYLWCGYLRAKAALQLPFLSPVPNNPPPLFSFLKWTVFCWHDKSLTELGGKMPSAHSYGVYLIIYFLVYLKLVVACTVICCSSIGFSICLLQLCLLGDVQHQSVPIARAVLQDYQQVTQCGAAPFLRSSKLVVCSKLLDYCMAWNWKCC